MKNYIKERSRIIFIFSSHIKFYECECKLNFQFMTVQNRKKILYRKTDITKPFWGENIFYFSYSFLYKIRIKPIKWNTTCSFSYVSHYLLMLEEEEVQVQVHVEWLLSLRYLPGVRMPGGGSPHVPDLWPRPGLHQPPALLPRPRFDKESLNASR